MDIGDVMKMCTKGTQEYVCKRECVSTCACVYVCAYRWHMLVCNIDKQLRCLPRKDKSGFKVLVTVKEEFLVQLNTTKYFPSEHSK